MNHLRITNVLLGMMFSAVVSAGSMGDASFRSWVVGLSAGPTWAFGNKTQTIQLEPDLINTYTAGKNNQTFTSGEIFLGWQKNLTSQPLSNQFGLAIAGAGNVKLSGDIWTDADPDFDNYVYGYKVNRVYIGAKDRLILDKGYILDPYASASIGASFNRAYHFHTQPKITAEYPPTNFQPNTNTAFSYALGLGLQKSWTTQLHAAVGYEFSSWGHVCLAPTPGQSLQTAPALNLYTHQLQFSLWYLI